jgi:hypothetical protein
MNHARERSRPVTPLPGIRQEDIKGVDGQKKEIEYHRKDHTLISNRQAVDAMCSVLLLPKTRCAEFRRGRPKFFPLRLQELTLLSSSLAGKAIMINFYIEYH